MNNLNSIFLLIILLCIPIYYVIGRRNFCFYLVILLVGSFLQRLGSAMLWEYSRSLSLLWFEVIGTIITAGLLIFIIKNYLRINIDLDKKTIIFLLTTSLGIGLRILRLEGSYNDVLSLGLVCNLLIAIIGTAYILHWGFHNAIIHDRGLLVSIVVPAALYVLSYCLLHNGFRFYQTWAYIIIAQTITWFVIGASQLRWHKPGTKNHILSGVPGGKNSSQRLYPDTLPGHCNISMRAKQ